MQGYSWVHFRLGAFPAASKLSSLTKLSEAASTGTTADKLAIAEAEDAIKLVKADAAISSTPAVVVAPGIPALPN